MNLEKSIIATLSFFDVLELPLKAPQVRQFLIDTEASLESTQKMLDDLTREKKIECWYDYYSLIGRGRTLQNSLVDRERVTRRYIGKVKRWRWLLGLTPYLRGAFLVNSVAFGNLEKESDIDFLIITEKNRLWFTRVWLTLLTQIFGLRRHGKKVAGRFCLSFFLSSEALNLEELALKSASFPELPQDPYLLYWIRTVKPVIGKQTYLNFQQANTWIEAYLPNLTSFRPETIGPEPRLALFCGRVLEVFFEITFLGRLFEKLFQLTLKRRTLRKRDNLRDKSGTVITDTILKFHNQDWRRLIFDQWLERLNQETGVRRQETDK